MVGAGGKIKDDSGLDRVSAPKPLAGRKAREA